MSLLNMNRASSRALMKTLVEKTKKVTKQTTTIKKGSSTVTLIKNICDKVEKELGKYEDRFELIDTEERLISYIDTSIKNGIISIDTETTGLDPICDEIVGLCLYTYNEKPAYIPINHISYYTFKKLDNQLSQEFVSAQIQRIIDNNVDTIFFNAKFDIRVLRHQLNVFINPTWCGFIASKVLKNNEIEASLKYLWNKYCNDGKEQEIFTFDKFFKGVKFNMIPPKTASLYAAKDALMTMDLYEFQKPYLTEDNKKCIDLGFQKLAKLYKEIELPIITIVADIEDTGVAIDVDYCKVLSEKYNNLLQDAAREFHTELLKYKDQIDNYRATHPNTKLEDPINIASSTQLAELFYDVLQVQPVSRKQPRGTGEDILEKMGHPLGKLILNYRGVAKLLNTYIDKMPNILNVKTGRIHCSFNQYGTDTGRFSCIARDSRISTPSGNINIEDIKSGDLVYSFSDNGELQLNKVKNIWYTGKRKCVKLYWITGYNKSIKGTLICTPDHYLKTYKGWKQAQELTPEDSIYYLRRNLGKNSDYINLSYSFRKQAYKEHRWIKENYFNCLDSSIEVHHKDANKLNNNPNNLQLLTRAEHVKAHREMKNGYCRAYDFTKEQVIKICEEVDWDIRKSKYDYESLKSWLKYYKINYIKEYSDCYDTRPTTMRASGKSFKYKSLPLIEENLRYALELANNNIDEAASYFGENSSKFVGACHKYELLPNHNVYKIEFLEEDYDVYDLEIENAHNFIANELCVHNSSNPNLQNIPSHNKDIRPMFVGSKNKTIETQDNIFNLLYCDKVQTLNGKKYSQDLQVGDILICKEGNYEVKNINIDGNNIRIEI